MSKWQDCTRVLLLRNSVESGTWKTQKFNMTYHYLKTPSSCSRNHYHPKHGGGGGAGCTSLSLTPPPCEAILNIPPLSGPGVRGATAKNQGHQNLPMENLHSDLELSIGDEPTIPVWQNHPKTKVKPIEIVFIWNASTIGTKTILAIKITQT